ncbi:carbohydrate ABC transporter permease, partial [Kineococcus esterisolvens]|uniref:carbohydrate ABC transporter permease n=1 Tax=Kineococcus sp. SYSU DK031 TaxID=3383152 RepID=UPI003D7E9791
MATTAPAPSRTKPTTSAHRVPGRRRSPYPGWFYLPAAVVYGVLFLVPTLLSFYFSMTRWTIFDSQFIGFGNFVQFFQEPALVKGFTNTFVYAVVTSGAKVVLGLGLGMLLTSQIVGRGYLRAVVFFPVLVSSVGVGITFQVLMHPSRGAINSALGVLGIDGPGWLVDPQLALLSVALVDVWKGVGLATLIYMAGIVSIPKEYYEAAK